MKMRKMKKKKRTKTKKTNMMKKRKMMKKMRKKKRLAGGSTFRRWHAPRGVRLVGSEASERTPPLHRQDKSPNLHKVPEQLVKTSVGTLGSLFVEPPLYCASKTSEWSPQVQHERSNFME